MHNPKVLMDKAEEVMGSLANVMDMNHFLIGGGMARDLLLGIPVKDIDIIIYGGDRKSPSFLRTDRALRAIGLLPISGETAYTKKGDQSNFIVYSELGGTKGPEVQAIVCKVAPEVFISQTFDLGLCQAALDCNGDFWVSDWFLHDIRHKSMSLLVRETISAYQIGYSIKEHVPRLKGKFPDYEFQVIHGVAEASTKLRKYNMS